MRVLAIILLLSQPALADPCAQQNYADPKKEPDWECPGPGEAIVLPSIRFKPSIGLPAGSICYGSPVSYEAVLLDKQKVISLGLRIKALRRLRWQDRHYGRQLLVIEKEYIADRWKSQLELERARVKSAIRQRNEARRERDQARKWYRSWTFGAVVGVVTTVVAVVAVAYVAKD